MNRCYSIKYAVRAFKRLLLVSGFLATLSLSADNLFYVWQPVKRGEVQEALKQAKEFGRFAILAYEFEWEGDAVQLRYINDGLLEIGELGQKPVLVIRVCGLRGSEQWRSFVFREKIPELLAQNTVAAQFSEVQIDYDCPTARLGDYLEDLKLLNKHSPLPVSITALPDWLRSESFPALAEEAAHYVLQVHGLEVPKSLDAIEPLCTHSQASQWLEKADSLGYPFYVALPTYSYVLGFDESGQFAAIGAEGTLPQAHRLALLHADPCEVFAISQEVSGEAYTNVMGVAWYRLPVPGDEFNWSWEGLHTLLQGVEPVHGLSAQSMWQKSGVLDIVCRNDGNVDQRMPDEIRVEKIPDLLASDGVNGYTRSRDAKGALVFEANQQTQLKKLAPGESVLVGWIRTRDEAAPHIILSPQTTHD